MVNMLFRTIVLAWISSISLFAMGPLVNAQWLQQHHDDKDLVVLDVSDAKDFAKGHIAGSINAPISLWREKHKHFLLVTNPVSMQKNLQRFGVNKNSKVVIYSHHTNGKDILKASYVIWAMEYYGFKKTAILDGGLPAWKKIKGEISTQVLTPGKGDFIINVNKNLVANLEDVKKNIAYAQMLDARPAVYYFGAQKQSVLKRAGHVEGARSYFWKYSFDNGLVKDKKIDSVKNFL